jgi:hypothetical protein
MAKHKSRRSTWLDQAKAQSLVRYGPELSSLMALRSENVTDYHRALHQAAAGRMGEQAAVAAALPQLKAIYAANEGVRKQAAGLTAGSLAGLGPAADAFKVAGLQEMGGALAALSQTGTQAQADLVSRGVRAAESEAGSRRTALAQYRTDQAKVTQRHQDLLGEMGAYTAATAGDLSTKAAQRRVTRQNNQDSNTQSERNSKRSAGIDPDTGKPIPGGKLDPKTKTGAGSKPQSRDAHNTLRTAITDAVDSALPLAKTFVKKKGSGTRGYVDSVLRSGVDEPATRSPVYDTIKTPTGTKQQARLNEDGTPVYKVAPAVKIDKVPAAARGAALDIIFDGHISAKHLRQLHQAGFSVNDLGLPTRRNPQAPRVRAPRPRSTASAPYVRKQPRVS